MNLEDFLLLDNSGLRIWYLLTRPQQREGIHFINQSRGENGEFHHLFCELRRDPVRFHQYFRMSIDTFDYLLDQIQHKLVKKWTNFNLNPIMPAERLAVTMR